MNPAECFNFGLNVGIGFYQRTVAENVGFLAFGCREDGGILTYLHRAEALYGMNLLGKGGQLCRHHGGP